jgi:nitroreductase
MDVIDAIRLRSSIRAYKPDPIPKEVLRNILDTAINAPSGLNIQPWEITVVTGEVLDNIRKANIDMLASKAGPHIPEYGSIYRQRQLELAIDIFKLMGIAREDKQARAQWMQRGYRFFDAPAAIILSIDESLDKQPLPLMDVGSISQTICLAAMKYKLGTCIEDQGIEFPEVIRTFTGISESKRIPIGIAIGYPDWEFPANRLDSRREPVDNVVTWLGYD